MGKKCLTKGFVKLFLRSSVNTRDPVIRFLVELKSSELRTSSCSLLPSKGEKGHKDWEYQDGEMMMGITHIVYMLIHKNA